MRPLCLGRAPFGQTLVEVLVALIVMSVTAVMVSGSFSTYRAMQDYARDQAVYQGLARERIDRLTRERPGEMMGALTAEMDLLALPPGQEGTQLSSSGTTKNAVDISALGFIAIPRTDPVPNDALLDLMKLSAQAAATKLQPLPGSRPRYVLYKYQLTILRKDGAGNDVPVYVMSAVSVDHES